MITFRTIVWQKQSGQNKSNNMTNVILLAQGGAVEWKNNNLQYVKHFLSQNEKTLTRIKSEFIQGGETM